jgi:hypothetical protein
VLINTLSCLLSSLKRQAGNLAEVFLVPFDFSKHNLQAGRWDFLMVWDPFDWMNLPISLKSDWLCCRLSSLMGPLLKRENLQNAGNRITLLPSLAILEGTFQEMSLYTEGLFCWALTLWLVHTGAFFLYHAGKRWADSTVCCVQWLLMASHIYFHEPLDYTNVYLLDK